jgi:hypothetical protein
MSGRRVSRPCDHCRTRKVKCDYAMPCDRCKSNHLMCAYNTARKKKGPKPGRGLVIDSIRVQYPQNSPVNDDTACVGRSEREDHTTATEDTNHEHPYSSSSHLDSSAHYLPSRPTNDDATGDLSDQHMEAVPNADGYFTFDEFAGNVLGSSASWHDASRFDHNSQHLAITTSTIANQASP